jgi:hypothetical protein
MNRMNARRVLSAALGAAAIVAMSGCSSLCGAREQRAVTLGAGITGLTVVRDGTTRRVEVVTRLTEPLTNPSTFDFVFNTIEGSRSGEGVALSLSGNDPVSDELVALTLALPVSLRSGDEYAVGSTFTIEVGLDSDPRSWGPHDLKQSNQAEAAFTIAKYSFPPPTFTVNFRAVTSTGTIRVTDRDDGSVEFTLNLSFTDANGKTTLVTGNVQGVTERYTPPCIS